MLCARGRPQSQEPMVGVRERPPAADGDEAGVAVFGEDHGCTRPVASAQLIVSRRHRGVLATGSAFARAATRCAAADDHRHLPGRGGEGRRGRCDHRRWEDITDARAENQAEAAKAPITRATRWAAPLLQVGPGSRRGVGSGRGGVGCGSRVERDGERFGEGAVEGQGAAGGEGGGEGRPRRARRGRRPRPPRAPPAPSPRGRSRSARAGCRRRRAVGSRLAGPAGRHRRRRRPARSGRRRCRAGK